MFETSHCVVKVPDPPDSESVSRFRTPLIARLVSLSAWMTSALLMLPVFLYATTIIRYYVNIIQLIAMHFFSARFPLGETNKNIIGWETEFGTQNYIELEVDFST
jgi:hypothetical protein